MTPAPTRGTGGIATDDRSVSEVLSVVLLVGLVLVATTVLVATGGQVIDSERDEVAVEQAEQSMKRLDAETSRVALGDGNAGEVDLGLGGTGGSLAVAPDRGWMRVSHVDYDTGVQTTVVNRSLGAVTYELDDTTVAYQGGGVWKRTGDGSTMLSRPEFHQANRTLTVPILSVDGSGDLVGEAEVRPNGSVTRHYPDRSQGLNNTLVNAKVVVTVDSAFYEAWGRFFATYTGASVGYDHGNERVRAVYLTGPRWAQPDAGVIATSGPGKLELFGTGAYVDSYESSLGDYAATATDDGIVEAAGDVVVSGDAEIAGDTWSGGVVDVDSSAGTIDGDVYWTDSYENDGTVTGNQTRITGIPSEEPIDSFVQWRVDRIRSDNDNANTSAISGKELEFTGGTAELDAGTYYLTHADVAGAELVVNTTDGDVVLGVRDWVRVVRQGGTDGRIRVVGDGNVTVVVAGRSEVGVSITGLGNRDVNFHVGKGSAVHVPDERARQFRVFAKRDFRATVAGSNGANAEFDGVLYAPAGQLGPGWTYVKQADVYGAVVTGNLSVGQYGAIHFDRSLTSLPLPLSPRITRLEYLHVAVHPVNVSGA